SLKCTGSGDFMKAWGGIASLQLGLAATWTEARQRGRTIEDIARWMCEAPATLVGLQARKGRIAVGCDADLVVGDPDADFTVDGKTLEHRHKLTPYAGRALRGRVRATFLRGERIFADGAFVGAPRGRRLRR